MSTRSESLGNWQRVADGDLDDRLVEWLRQRAAEIVGADQLPSGQRPDAVVRATGLHGRDEAHAHVRDAVEVLLEFDPLDAHGAPRPPVRGEETRTMIAAARHAAPGWAHLTDDEVRKRLARMFARKR